MTLTLLLQLTDDEQLYARQQELKTEATEAKVPVEQEPEGSAATWPIEGEADC